MSIGRFVQVYPNFRHVIQESSNSASSKSWLNALRGHPILQVKVHEGLTGLLRGYR